MASKTLSTSPSTSSNPIPDLSNDDKNKNSENNFQALDILEVAKYKNIELRYLVLHSSNPEPWFYGPFIASQLGYKDDSVIENFDSDFVMSFEEILKHKNSLNNGPLEENVNSKSLFVNIAGLQYLIFKSKCPLKLEIQDWLHRELLPIIANRNNDSKNDTKHKKINEEEEYISQLLKKLQITELELEKQRVKNQEQEQHISRLSELFQITEVELEEEKTKNQELQNKISKMTKRRVRMFRNSKNKSLEHFLCIIVKDPKQKKYDEESALYYIPGIKNLDNRMPEANMRFITIRGQARYCKKRVKELVEKRGYEIVRILVKPDPVTGLNLLYREAQSSNNTSVENRDAFTTQSTSRIVKKGICIDMNFNIYYDKHIK